MTNVYQVKQGIKSGLVLFLLLGVQCALAAEPVVEYPLEERVGRLERMLSNRQEMALMKQIESIQQEFLALQGQLEEANQQIDVLKQQQRSLYLDLDRRLLNQAEAPQQKKVPKAAQFKQEAVQHKTAVVTPSVASIPAVANEKQVYQQAYSALTEKQYAAAEDKFKKYLKTYPSGLYAPNAYYWLGEIYLLESRNDEALTAFYEVRDQYSSHQKVGDALLKIGYVFDAKGDEKRAKVAYEEVVSKYKGSAIAQLAHTRLTRLKTAN